MAEQNAINEIQEAEQKAAQEIEETKEKITQNLNNLKQKQEENIKNAPQLIDSESNAIISKAKGEIEEIKEDGKKKREDDLEKLEKTPAAKIKEAVTKVIKQALSA